MKYIRECQNENELKEIIRVYILVFEFIVENDITDMMCVKCTGNASEVLSEYTTKVMVISRKIRMLKLLTSNEKEIIKHMSLSELRKIIDTFNYTIGIVYEYLLVN